MVPSAEEQDYWYWSEMAHKFHVATDGTCYVKQHPLCPFCNPPVLEGDKKPWLGRVISAPIAPEPVETTTAVSAGRAVGQDGRAEDEEPSPATSASWAYEHRQTYLSRKLTHTGQAGPQLISDGFWTGETDPDGMPIPAEEAFTSGLWQREVWPVYDGPEPVLNKMRSLRDTLIMSPESGPRLVACGLWSGRYDKEGMPIP